MTERDIAIIGVSCRFPDADDTTAFFNNLRNGHCSVKRFSDNELAATGIDKAVMRQANYKPYGAPLNDEFGFDHQHFRLTPKEARLLDPQHRLLMELTVHALDDAGIASVNDKKVGLFGSVSASSYFLNYLLPAVQTGKADFSLEDALRGSRPGFAISRIAYHIGLTGPAMLVDTACSSSLVAVHEAVRAIRQGECAMALAGGVSVQLPSQSGYLYHKDGILSEDGLCRAFDATATGSIRGHGGGMLLLKAFNKAMDDGDNIYAVITGSAVNNDGKERAGFTAPGIPGQASSLQQALQDAGIHGSDLAYYEAHGSGTRLGDEIELKAIYRALQNNNVTLTDANQPLKIGSVKTNIGHLDNAAGIAGLIKTLLMLKHRQLVPSLHFSRPNATLARMSNQLQVQTLAQPLPETRPLNAVVASLGIGGTNAHIILKDHKVQREPANGFLPDVLWLPVSASHEEALPEQVAGLLEAFHTNQSQQVTGIINTLWDRRRHYQVRRVFSGRSPEELIARMQAFLEQASVTPFGEQQHVGTQPLPAALSAWLQGESLSFSQLYPNHPPTDWVRLPGYRFVRQRHAIEAPIPAQADTDLQTEDQPAGQSGSQAPKDITGSLTVLWEKSFGFSPIGAQQNFFELGGHSLLATQIIATLNEQFGISLGLKEFFDHPTIASLAELIAHTTVTDRPTSNTINYQQVPLTPMQQELWYQQMRQPDSITYNLVAAECVHGPVHLNNLYEAVIRVVQRYAILRSRFELTDNQLFQVATDTVYQTVHFQDNRLQWAGLNAAEKQAAIAGCIDAFGNQPFDLSLGRLFEACIVRVAADEQLLILRQHRIVSDARTLGTLFQEIVSYYLSLNQNESVAPVPIDHGYFDYCFQLEQALHDRQLASPMARRLQQDRIFWQQSLRNPSVTRLPTTNPHHCRLPEAGRSLRFTLKKEITPQLQAYCAANGISLFSFLLATFKLTLFSFTRQTDITVVTPALNRDQLEFSQTPGHFMNRVAIRSRLQENHNLTETLKAVHHNSTLALQHQSLPFESMLETTGLLSRYRNEPLFQTVFMLQDTEQDESLTLPGISLEPVPVPFNRSRYDLTGVMRLEKGTFFGRLDCKAALLDEATLNRIKDRWIALIDRVLRTENSVLIECVDSDINFPTTEDQKNPGEVCEKTPTEPLNHALNYWQLALGRYLPPDEQPAKDTLDFWQSGGTTGQLVSLYHLMKADYPDLCFRKLAAHPHLAAHANYLGSLNNQRWPSEFQEEPSAQGKEPLAQDKEHPPTECELSPFQRRLWFLQKYHPTSSAYNLPAAFYIEGSIDPARLHAAILSAQRNFYLLSCGITEQNDQPRWVLTDTNVSWQNNDLSGLDPEARDTSMDFLSEKILWSPFDLNKPHEPLWRCAWVKLAPSESVLLFSFHHLIADQVSGGLFLQALLDHYQNTAQNKKPNTAPSRAPIANEPATADFPAFVAAQQQWLGSGEARSQRAFWRAYLNGCRDFHFRHSAGGKELTTQEYVISLTGSQTQGLQHIGAQLSVPLSTVVQTLFGILLYRMSGNNNYCMGMPASLHEGNWQSCFGPLLSTLPVKFEVKPFRNLQQQIQACHEYMMEAIAHKDLPLEDIIEISNPNRNTDLPPLFQILYAFREEQPLTLGTSNFQLTTIPTTGNASEYPIALEALTHADGTELRLSLSQVHFNEATRQQIADHFYQLIEECLRHPEREITRFLQPDLPAPESEPKPKPESSQATNLASLFLETAATYPDKTAITGTNYSLNYQTLEHQIAAIQQSLLKQGLQNGQGVALYLEDRSLLPQLLMACLATGLYFVPVDTRWNSKRISRMLTDADVSALITDSPNSAEAIDLPEGVILIRSDHLPGKSQPTDYKLAPVNNENNLAYIMYTSGSTGTPKGVAIRQNALASFCRHLPETVKPGPEHIVLALTASSFDIMLTELLLPLLSGGTIALYNEPIMPETVSRFIQDQQINYIQTTPSIWSLLLESPSLTLKPGTTALVGGEALPTQLAERLLNQNVRLFNLYGPTEATVWCTCKPVNQQTLGSSDHAPPARWITHIGRPFANTRALILDESGTPLADGAIGELALQGDNLSAGYWKDDIQNARRFITVPEPDETGNTANRFYRTGDLAQWLNGELHFHGRTDNQIKLNGQRIELNEINSAISSVTGVKDVFTILIDRESHQFLASYVVADDTGAEEIKAALMEMLPFHYIPQAISVNERAQLSSNGKWDAQKVREHLRDAMNSRSTEPGYIANNTYDEITQTVRALMGETLHQPGMGFRDNFFALGGHSLLVVRLTNRLAQEFAIQLPLNTVFEHPTAEQLGMLINASLSQAPAHRSESAYEEGEI